MNRNEFQEAMNELIDSYGEKLYPNAVMNRVWNAVNGIDMWELKNAIDQLLDTTNRAPSVAQIRSACRDAIGRAVELERKKALLALGGECGYCLNTGKMEAYLKDDPETTAVFMCNHCRAATLYNLIRFPRWTPTSATAWVLINHKLGGFKRWADMCHAKRVARRRPEKVIHLNKRDPEIAPMLSRVSKGDFSDFADLPDEMENL